MQLIATIDDPAGIQRILTHLGLPGAREDPRPPLPLTSAAAEQQALPGVSVQAVPGRRGRLPCRLERAGYRICKLTRRMRVALVHVGYWQSIAINAKFAVCQKSLQFLGVVSGERCNRRLTLLIRFWHAECGQYKRELPQMGEPDSEE
jgi:hypothetical protein